jgi:hypothetical protein
MTARDWREWATFLGIEVPHWKAHALDYLEAQGLRFCVDFGTDNAVEKAREHWTARKRPSVSPHG